MEAHMARGISGSNGGMGGPRPTRRRFLTTAGTTAAGAFLLDMKANEARADTPGPGDHVMLYRPACIAVTDPTNQKVVTGGDRKAVFQWKVKSDGSSSWTGMYKKTHSKKVSFVAVNQYSNKLFQA